MRCPLHLFMPLRESSMHLKPNEKLYLYLSLLRDNKTERTWTDVGCHNNGPVERRRLGRLSGSGRSGRSVVCSWSSASSWRKGSVWRQAGGREGGSRLGENLSSFQPRWPLAAADLANSGLLPTREAAPPQRQRRVHVWLTTLWASNPPATLWKLAAVRRQSEETVCAFGWRIDSTTPSQLHKLQLPAGLCVEGDVCAVRQPQGQMACWTLLLRTVDACLQGFVQRPD